MSTEYRFTVEGDDYEDIYKNTLDELERFFGFGYVGAGNVTWTIDAEQQPAVRNMDGHAVVHRIVANVTATYKEPH